MKKIWDILGKKHAIDVLIFIYEHPGEMQKTIIEAESSGRSSRLERIADLIKAGYVRDESTGADWTAISYFVTEEGAKVARSLINIERGVDVIETDHGASAPEGHKVK